MSRTPVWIAALAALAALAAAPGAQAARVARLGPAARGDLLVSFSGAGGGSYRFHAPAVGGSAACRVADTTYAETDSYHWSYRFLVAPGGGSSDAPVALAAGGQLSASEQLLQCAGTAAATSTCTQTLRAPPAADAGDLAYPGVTVALEGPSISVGAVGELLPATAQPFCSGVGVLLPNPAAAFAQLQASVSIPRAGLASTGAVMRHFRIAGSSLYAGVALSGSCDSTACDPAGCQTSAGDSGDPGPPSTCSFSESYSGTIEVRVIR